MTFLTNKGSMIDLKIPGFKKELPVYFSTRGQKKDLIIFYPGVFGKPDGRISPHVIHELEKQDIHLVVIPNLLAYTYLKARSRILKKEPILNEQINQNKIFLEVLNKIGRGNIDKIHVIAESLGSFQALMGLNPSETKLPSIESVTLLWPPLYLNRAIKRFDDLISKSLPHLESCTLWWKWPKIIYSTKAYAIPIPFKDEEKRCLGSWVIGSGFVGAIKETAEKVTSISTKVPSNFTEFIKLVLPEMLFTVAQDDKRTSIEHLLGSFRDTKTKVRIVSSVDDFLNIPEEWETFKKSRTDLAPNIYLFSWGGHSGPIGMEDFLGKVAKNILQ